MGKEDDGEGGGKVLLTPPLALEGGLAVEHRVPNIVQRILSLFGNIRPGSDLTRFQLPPLFNIPKSHLQMYGESVYCFGEDLLGKCAKGKNPLDRLANVVAWSISTTRPMIFGAAPLNPVLGETHHVSNGNLNVRLEQVSHHPPVSALHATDEQEQVELVWCQNPTARYYGTSVEAVINGKRVLKLLNFGETYEMNSPKALIRFFPVPGSNWVGNVRIRCRDSGLEADICYEGKGFLGFGGNHRSIKGKIFDSSSSKIIYEINGFWDSIVTLKNVHSGETTMLYNAKDTIGELKTPSLRDPEGLEPTESVVVWRELGERILKREWEKAREAKTSVEERQRQADKERKTRGERWVPKYFTVSQTAENGWDCFPKEPTVPPAPIIASQECITD
ncbi:oxysterol-binding protein-related protein 4C-like isoform X2 [Aristolochia californica]|uniref:oxysterol-binding protein-related protein 4C-like isoform X2 n=1 Tax=Aristolochia californica TaxID=171875 RepID=UPI0035E06FA4